MKQLSQLIVLSSIGFISASTSQDMMNNDDAAIDAPARNVVHTKKEINRSPAVEPRVYVQDEKTGEMYYYDYPKQVSHAEQTPPKL
jgi:hypothetical protein